MASEGQISKRKGTKEPVGNVNPLTAAVSAHADLSESPLKKMKKQSAIDNDEDDHDQSAVLLTGFDSDGDDSGADEGFDPSNMGDLNLDKKQRKKLRQAAKKGDKDEPGSVYVGRIPHGFFEREMRQYFSQFGNITKLRLSRNRTTGASKHFAFIEFESNAVAKIVAETMDNYLMFGHILKCKYAPTETLHPDTYKGANKRFKKVPFNKIEKRKLEEAKTKDQWDNKIEREQAKRAKKAERLKGMGYEFEMPTIQSVDAALERKKLTEEIKERAIILPVEAEPATGAIEASKGFENDTFVPKLGKEKKKSTNIAPTEDSFDSSAANATEPPKFAIHPDEIKNGNHPKSKSKKSKKSAAIA